MQKMNKYKIGDEVLYYGPRPSSALPDGYGGVAYHEFIDELLPIKSLSKKHKAYFELHHIERQAHFRWRIIINKTP